MKLKLYTIPNCEECEKVKKEVKNIPGLEIVELSMKDDNEKWCEKIKTEKDGTIVESYVPLKYIGYPVLYFGVSGENEYALSGEEGIIQFLEKGFVHDIKTCPLTKGNCMEKNCEMFSILYNGLIPEGSCSIKWIPLLMTEIISKGK